ncbi:MAG: asparaginase domain-containing protein, partial [Bacteroidota bacterium]
NRLYRGNRTTKYSAEHFSAFRSANFPPLAEAGIDIEYNSDAIRYPKKGTGLKIYEKLDSCVAVLKIFPGLNKETFNAVTGSKDLKGLIIETFGSGNAITHKWFIDGLKNLVRNNVPVLNVTQCLSGSVNMERYQTGRNLLDAGVTGGADITIESAVVKMMFLLANTSGIDEIKLKLQKSLRGEINAI